MAVVLDAGALVAVDRGDRAVGAVLRVAHARGVPVRTSAAVLAQVWRGGPRQANLARVLTGVAVLPLDERVGRRVGEALAASATRDVVDAHVALLATGGDLVLTSDVGDVTALLGARSVPADVQHV